MDPRSAARVLVLSLVVSAGATAASPRPNPLNSSWPACADSSSWFCIESATRDGVDLLHGQGRSVDGSPLYVSVSFLDENSVNWAVNWGTQYGELPTTVAGSTFRMVLRLGDLQPQYTTAIADRFHLFSSGDAATGYRVTIEGSLAVINWSFQPGFSCTEVDCGDSTARATIGQRTFSGNTQNMALWDADGRSRFGGAWVATNAQRSSTVLLYGLFPQPFWYLNLANPHLDVAGAPAHGSFTAWVPPNYFASLPISLPDGGTSAATAADALDAGFEITRGVFLPDGGLEATGLDASVQLDDGGIYFRIESMSYSASQIKVAQRPRQTSTPPGRPPAAAGSSGCSSAAAGAGGAMLLVFRALKRAGRQRRAPP